MAVFHVLMFPIYLIVWFGNFIEWVHKKIDPCYTTYSEYLSSMSDQEHADYMRQRRIERRVVYNYRRHRRI